MKRRHILAGLGVAGISIYALLKSHGSFDPSSASGLTAPAENDAMAKMEQLLNDLDLNYEPLSQFPSRSSSNSISSKK